MKEQDKIKELFSEKLGNYQAPVRPELWANISAQVGTPAAASGGLSIIAKTIIGFGLVASTVTAIVLYVNRQQDKSNKPPKTELVSSTNDSLIEVNSNEEVRTNNMVMPTATEKTQINNHRLDCELDLSAMGDFEPIALPEVLMNYQNEGNQQSQENEAADIKNEEVVNNETVKANEGNDDTKPNIQGEELGAEEDVYKPDVVNEIVLPNIFSPNGDGENDRLQIVCDGLTDFNVVILNKQNQTVFQSKDPNFSWDGIDLNGAQVENGNYVYFITAVNSVGTPIQKHNTLFITR